jgi:hypothetical protein
MTAKYLIVGFLFVASCRQPVAELSADEKKSITGNIHKTLTNYFYDINQKGLTAEFKYLDSSSDFYWVPPGYTSSIPYDSVATILKKNQGLSRTISNAWESLTIKPLRTDLATYTGRIYSVITDSSGKEIKMKLLETGVLIKRGDDWKLLSGQTSIIQP